MDKTQKYLTYANTVLIILLLIASIHPVKVANHVLGVAGTGSVTNFYDVNFDTSNGIGKGVLSINTIPVISSSTGGVNGAFSTITATTSLINTGDTTLSSSSITNLTIGTSSASQLNGFKCTSMKFDPPLLSPGSSVFIDVTSTMANNSSSQMFLGTFAVSGAITSSLMVNAVASGTNGYITAALTYPSASTTNGVIASSKDFPQGTLNVCGFNFISQFNN